jgi:Aspartyl protease
MKRLAALLAVLPACVAMLASVAARRPGQAQSAASAGSTMPVERSANVFFARASINGQGPFWLTVDTGATLTVLDPSTVRALGLTVRESGAQANVGVAAGLTAMATTGGATIRIGDAPPFTPGPLYVVPVRAAETPMDHRIDGVLGTDFLRKFVVEFDYPGSRVGLHPAGSDVPTKGGSSRIRIDRNVLIAPARLRLPDAEVVKASLLVDTGSSSGLSLNTPFVLAHRLEERFPSRELSAAVGINGMTLRGVMRQASLSLGSAEMFDSPAALSRESEGLAARADFDGIVGADWLRQFRLVIDYPRRAMSVEAGGR